MPDNHGTNSSVPSSENPDDRSFDNQPSLFQKCHQFFDPSGEYRKFKDAGLYPYFRPIEGYDGPHVSMNGQNVIMAGSNNYLGLMTDPRVKEAALDAIKKYGTGCTGSRFLNGTLDLHIELEERLASFMDKDSAVLFSTGYMTNQGVIQSLAGRNDQVFSDKDNHACIVAGTQMSMATTYRFRHNDMDHLRQQLEMATDRKPDAGRLIVTDGVFSMSGIIANVPELVELADEFDAALMLDDAHAVGAIGPGGTGSAAYYQLKEEVPLITGTFSKSFASLGGFCVGDEHTIEYIRHTSSPHIFSASMPPANVATVLKCLDILENESGRLERLWEISDYMRDGFQNLGFDVWNSQTPIIPVVIGDTETCFRFWNDLLDEGVFVNAVVPPAVPQGQGLLRTSYMATHTNEDLDFILEAFRRVGIKNSIISGNGVQS